MFSLTRLTMWTLALSAQAADVLPEGATARLGTQRWRPGSPAVLVAYLADGKSVLTVNAEYVAHVWDADGNVSRQFDTSAGKPDAGPERPIPFASPAAALSGDGKVLAVLGRDGVLRRWDPATGKELGKFETKMSGLTSRHLALSPDGKTVAIANATRKLVLWDADGKEVGTIEVAGGGAGAGRAYLDRIDFTADGKELVLIGHEREGGLGGGAAGLRGSKPTVVIWDVATRKEKRRLGDRPFTGLRAAGSTTIVLSPDGKLLAVSDRTAVHMIDVAEGKAAGTIRPAGALSLTSAELVFSPDVKQLVVLGRSSGLTVYDVATRKELVKGEGERVATAPPSLGRGSAPTLAVSPNGKTLVRADGSLLQRFDLTTGKLLDAGAGHTGAVGDVAFGPDGKTVVTAGPDGARTWDAGTGKETAFRPAGGRANSHPSILTPDGKTLAVPDMARGVRLVDVGTGKDLRTLQAEFRLTTGNSMAFSPDGKTLAFASSSRPPAVQLFDTASGKERLQIALPENAEAGRPNPNAQFSPDGILLAVVGLPSGVTLYETGGGKTRRTLKLPRGIDARQASFAPDSRTLAVDLHDGSVALFELATGAERATLGERKAAPEGAVPVLLSRVPADLPTVAWSPDARLLARADEGRGVTVWDVRTGKAVTTLKGHGGEVRTPRFSADGKLLATGGADTTALLWDVATIRKKLAAGPALAKDRAEACWKDLLDTDARTAFAAVRDLAGDPKQALPLLKQHLKPCDNPDAKVVAKLIAELDSDQFAVRDKARRELEAMGDRAEPALREVLKREVSAEVRKAAESLLENLKPSELTGEALRAVRALEALEWMGTPEAVELVKAVAGGAPETAPTRHAKAVLQRLAK